MTLPTQDSISSSMPTTSLSSSASSSTTITSTIPLATPQTATQAPAPTSPTSSLSLGAEIGVVLAGVALVAFAIAFVLLFRRNRKMRLQTLKLIEQQKVNAELRNMAYFSPISQRRKPVSTVISSLGSVLDGGRSPSRRALGSWNAMSTEGKRSPIHEIDEENEIEVRLGSDIIAEASPTLGEGTPTVEGLERWPVAREPSEYEAHPRTPMGHQLRKTLRNEEFQDSYDPSIGLTQRAF